MIEIIVVTSLLNVILKEKNKRVGVEHELESTRNSMKTTLEKVIQNNNINAAKITYVAYFGQVSDSNADGMI